MAKSSTIYIKSESGLGVVRYTTNRDVKVETGVKWAQHKDVTRVTWIPAGRRTPRIMTFEGRKPYLLVLEGKHHPAPDGIWEDRQEEQNGSPVIVQRCRYRSFDDRWYTDFDAMIDPYIEAEGVKVLCDFRWTKIAPTVG